MFNSEKLFTTFLTLQNSADRSLQSDSGVMHFELATGSIEKVFWILVRRTLADVATKPNNLRKNVFQPTTHDCKPRFDLDNISASERLGKKLWLK